MPENAEKRFRVMLRSQDGEEFSASFGNVDESLETLEDLLRVRGAFEKRDLILRIRGICETEDERTFFPHAKTNLPKARWVSVAAAASYPRGVLVDDILSRTDLSSEKVSAYCTSKNNPTSKYLYRGGNRVFITPNGIDWLFNLLKKDKQIDDISEITDDTTTSDD